MKTCTKCGAEKALDEFYFMKSKGRHEARCLTCRAAYQAAWRGANKERIREYQVAYDATYRKANKDRINERKAAYYKANKEQISEQQAAYYKANKERINERNAAYYRANKERLSEWQAAYNKANKERVRERSAAYREANKERLSEYFSAYQKTPRGKEVARKRHQRRKVKMRGGILAPGAVDHVPSNQCYWCGDIADKMHEDHVIPVVRGGSNEPMNLVWACAPCNLRKNAKHPLRWIAEQFEEAV